MKVFAKLCIFRISCTSHSEKSLISINVYLSLMNIDGIVDKKKILNAKRNEENLKVHSVKGNWLRPRVMAATVFQAELKPGSNSRDLNSTRVSSHFFLLLLLYPRNNSRNTVFSFTRYQPWLLITITAEKSNSLLVLLSLASFQLFEHNLIFFRNLNQAYVDISITFESR